MQLNFRRISDLYFFLSFRKVQKRFVVHLHRERKGICFRVVFSVADDEAGHENLKFKINRI